MLRKIIRAILGKEDYELDVEVELSLTDVVFILAILIVLVWMLTTI